MDVPCDFNLSSVKKTFSSTNIDGSFTTAVSNSFLSP